MALVLFGPVPDASATFFQYSSTIDVSNIIAPTAPPVGNGTGSVSLTTALGTLFTLTAANSVGPDNIDGSGTGSDIVFVNIAAAVSSGTLFETVTFDYSLHLKIDDYGASATGGSVQGTGTFNINGTITELLGPGKKITLLSNVFTSPPNQSQIINSNMYTVSLYKLVPPGASNAGVFGLHVSPVPIPEPGTLALFGIGSVMMAIPAYRRWRRKA